MVGDASDRFYVDLEAGLLGQFRHQYFILFLIPHIHKATLLMLSDRMVSALNKLQIEDPDSIRRFKRTIRQLLEIFLRFTHRYWFHEVSDQAQAKELYRMTSGYLGTDRLYSEIRDEIEDMSNYLETDTFRRQANTVVRLTVVTVFGLIGSITTGIFGMNILGFGDMPLARQIVLLVATIGGVCALLFYTLAKSKAARRLSRRDLRRAAAGAGQGRYAGGRMAEEAPAAAVTFAAVVRAKSIDCRGQFEYRWSI